MKKKGDGEEEKGRKKKRREMSPPSLGCWFAAGAGQDVQRVCNCTHDTAFVYNQCFVRLFGIDFLAPPNNTGMVPLISGTNIPSGVDVAAYNAVITRLLNATARYAVDRDSSPPSSSPRLYSVGNKFQLRYL
jgi:hypothetical protein